MTLPLLEHLSPSCKRGCDPSSHVHGSFLLLNFLTLQPEPHSLLVHHSIFCGLISWSRLEWKSLESKPAPGVLIFLYSAKVSDRSSRSPLSRSQAARVSPFQPHMPRGHRHPVTASAENVRAGERATGQNDSKSIGPHHT